MRHDGTKWTLLSLIAIMVATFVLVTYSKAEDGYKYFPPKKPTDPNDKGQWVWQYTNDANEIKTIYHPTAVPKWEYHITNKEVFLVIRPAPVAEKVSEHRWVSTDGKLRKYTHKEFLVFMAKHWLDKENPESSFNLRDFALLAKHWSYKEIKNPVFVLPTSKKYHLETCRYVTTPANFDKISLEEAKGRGLEPCGICKPYVEVEQPTDPNSVVTDPNTTNLLDQFPKVAANDETKIYHVVGADCANDTHVITIIEAMFGGYEQCPICKPNDNLSEGTTPE